LIPAGTGLDFVKDTQVVDERLKERVLEGDARGERARLIANQQQPAGD
jgi:hypothetical protein